MILYRTSGAWGAGTGANLSAAQVDGNFYDISMRVQFMELNAPTPIQITSFTSSGSQLYINMSDGTTHGPLTLPVSRWRPRGVWAPNIVYTTDDIVIGPDSATYLVIFSHTSGTSFSAAASDGQGHSFYSLLLQVPSTSIPSGGVTGTVLTKNSENNYDLVWSTPPAPAGGLQGQFLSKSSDQDGHVHWNYLYLASMRDFQYVVPFADGDYLSFSFALGKWINRALPSGKVAKQTSWSPVVGDQGTFMVINNGTAEALVSIVLDAEENFPIGSELHVHQEGTGRVRIEGDPGVTIRRHASFSHYLLGQYATATVKKTAANEWRLFGLLAGA